MTSKGMRHNSLFPYINFLILTIMAITNRELLLNQVKRIREKTGVNFNLHMTTRNYYIEDDDLQVSLDKTPRNASQMREFLSGFEIVYDYFHKRKELLPKELLPKKVYFIRCEVNDKGWHTGYHHFARLEDANKLMRNYVARQIWYAREEKKKVFLKVFGDSVMGDVSKNPQRSQNIFVRIDNDTFEYRVWSEDLRYSELPKGVSYHY